MSADAISRLLAGLERDERLARAATDLPRPVTKWPEKRPPWEPERWRVDEFCDLVTVNGAADPIWEGDSGGGPRDIGVAEHIAAHDPARVLRWVSVVRQMIATRNGLAGLDHECEQCDGYRVEIGLYDAIFADLADIYTEDTDEE
ncbi:DUF6221 family protein [Nocardia flavorosea]|nr:DUF6221 family protein [Nocardia flavorosea]